jgi:hypothetical protein
VLLIASKGVAETCPFVPCARIGRRRGAIPGGAALPGVRLCGQREGERRCFASCGEGCYTATAADDSRGLGVPQARGTAARTTRGPGDEKADMVARPGVAAWRVFSLGGPARIGDGGRSMALAPLPCTALPVRRLYGL